MIPPPNDISEGYSSTGLNKDQHTSNLLSPLGSYQVPPPLPVPTHNLSLPDDSPRLAPIVTKRLSHSLMPPELPAPKVAQSYVDAALVNPAAKSISA